jgi:ribonuclease P protein component
MLKKVNRLDKKTLDLVFKSKNFLKSTNLYLRYFKNKEEKGYRIVFVVPKSVEKLSSHRNLLKRRAYFVLKNNIKSIPDGLIGAFVFNKDSSKVFGGRKNKAFDPILNLDKEINSILSRL